MPVKDAGDSTSDFLYRRGGCVWRRSQQSKRGSHSVYTIPPVAMVCDESSPPTAFVADLRTSASQFQGAWKVTELVKKSAGHISHSQFPSVIHCMNTKCIIILVIVLVLGGSLKISSLKSRSVEKLDLEWNPPSTELVQEALRFLKK